jgi:hypothetical protein
MEPKTAPNEKIKIQRPAHGEINQVNGSKEIETAIRPMEGLNKGL